MAFADREVDGACRARHERDQRGLVAFADDVQGAAAAVDTTQQRLFPDWRHHTDLTDLTGDPVTIDRFHRQHAVVELAIRDIKDGAGLEHIPPGNFHANSAWLQCAVLAHNPIRWTTTLGRIRVENELTVARTIRTRHIAIPGRLVNHSGTSTLRRPTHWPWRTTLTHALQQLRSLAFAPG